MTGLSAGDLPTGRIHVVPTNDLIEHETVGDGCPCGPDVEAVFRDDGSNGWLICHHSLDGRERFEHDNRKAPGNP